MQRKRMAIVAAGFAAALSLSATTMTTQVAFGQRAEQARQTEGRYQAAQMSELPNPPRRVIEKYARGSDEVKVWRITEKGEEDIYEATFPNKQGERMVMKVAKDGKVIVPPTELPEREANAADANEAREIEHVELSELPNGARQALGKATQGASDIDYMRVVTAGKREDDFLAHYTQKDGQRMQLWVKQNGDVVTGPKPTRYQPEDRGDEQARARDRERARARARERAQSNDRDDRAQPAAARTGRGLQVVPLDPEELPTAVEKAFRKEAGTKWDKANQAAVFRVGEDEYALQYDEDKNTRMGMRVDRQGNVITPLRQVKWEEGTDRQNPENQYFRPSERGGIPKKVSDQFRETTGTSLDDAKDVQLFNIAGDTLIRYTDDGRPMAIRIDKESGKVVAGPYEIPERRSNRDAR
jgi:hypothetical protein